MKKNLSPGNNVVGNDLVTKPHQHHIILPSKYVRKVARSIRTRQSTVTPVAEKKKKKGTKKKTNKTPLSRLQEIKPINPKGTQS